MVKHSLIVGSDDYTSEIQIQEDNNECVIIIDDKNSDKAEAYLTLQQLHDFIGTLLHVQQKIKNR
jgi:hypothetical protein